MRDKGALTTKWPIKQCNVHLCLFFSFWLSNSFPPSPSPFSVFLRPLRYTFEIPHMTKNKWIYNHAPIYVRLLETKIQKINANHSFSVLLSSNCKASLEPRSIRSSNVKTNFRTYTNQKVGNKERGQYWSRIIKSWLATMTIVHSVSSSLHRGTNQIQLHFPG